MLAVVFAAAWADYLVGYYGWCLLKNYAVTIGQLANPLHPYAGKWPPGAIGPNRVFPGTAAASGSSSSSSDGTVTQKGPGYNVTVNKLATVAGRGR